MNGSRPIRGTAQAFGRRHPTRRLAPLVASVLVLAACGGEDEPAQEATGATDGGLRGDLVVWDWQYDSPTTGAALKEIDAAFQADHPDVELTHIQQGFEQYDQVVQTSMISGEIADVVLLQPGASGVLKYAESLTGLTELIDAADRERLLGWPLVSEGLDADGAAYAVPVGTQTSILYYNKQLFEQAGLDPESPPESFEELAQAAAELKDAGITPFGGGDADIYLWLPLLWPAVGTDEEARALGSGELSWTDEKVRAAVQIYADLHTEGYFPEGAASIPLFGEAGTSFAAGEQAMFVGLASTDLSFTQFNEGLGEANVGIVQGLGRNEGDGAHYLPVGPALAWSIPVASGNADAAVAYATHLSTPDSQRTLFELSGLVPNDPSVDLGDSAPAQPRQMLADWAAEPTGASVLSYVGIEVLAELRTQVQLVITGQASVEDALAAIDAVQERS